MKRKSILSCQSEENGSSVVDIRKGSVVFNMNTMEFGVVSRVTEHCLVVPARCTTDGRLSLEEVVMPASDCRLVTREEKVHLQILFNEKRLCWDPRRAVVKANDFLPMEGDRVRISLLGEPVATGIFRQIDPHGYAVFYCLLLEDGTLRYSMSEILGPASSYQFMQIGSTARNKLSKAMEAAHVVWNGHLHRFELEKVSLGRREFYYYLDEYLQIRKVQDTYKPRDRKRKTSGNYFASFEEAHDVQECYMAVLRLHHCDARRKKEKTKGE